MCIKESLCTIYHVNIPLIYILRCCVMYHNGICSNSHEGLWWEAGLSKLKWLLQSIEEGHDPIFRNCPWESKKWWTHLHCLQVQDGQKKADCPRTLTHNVGRPHLAACQWAGAERRTLYCQEVVHEKKMIRIYSDALKYLIRVVRVLARLLDDHIVLVEGQLCRHLRAKSCTALWKLGSACLCINLHELRWHALLEKLQDTSCHLVITVCVERMLKEMALTKSEIALPPANFQILDFCRMCFQSSCLLPRLRLHVLSRAN